MFETFLNAILIFNAIMGLVQCYNPVVIREDRVYRYVGNGSNSPTLSDEPIEEPVLNAQVDENRFPQTNSDFETIPDSLLIQMKNIQNASDFIANFLMEDKSQKDIYLSYLENGFASLKNDSEQELNINEERTKLTKLPDIGTPAGCIPEMKIIELKADNSHSELYFPSCVRIPRCSGCCPSQRLHCIAVNTSYEDISVIRVKYSPIEKRLKFEGFKVFRIEKHDKCNCDCIQKANQCSTQQIYSESECRCRCPDAGSAQECTKSNNKFWDSHKCQCKCKSVPFCSTGFTFNDTTCRCEAQEKDFIPETNRGSGQHSTGEPKTFGSSKYAINKNIDSELETQRHKGFDLYKTNGINPDIDDNYRSKDS